MDVTRSDVKGQAERLRQAASDLDNAQRAEDVARVIVEIRNIAGDLADTFIR